jgi:hypothetical protein
MRMRLQQLDGQLEIQSEPGRTVVTAIVPLNGKETFDDAPASGR